jgi:hypothetical protein
VPEQPNPGEAASAILAAAALLTKRAPRGSPEWIAARQLLAALEQLEAEHRRLESECQGLRERLENTPRATVRAPGDQGQGAQLEADPGAAMPMPPRPRPRPGSPARSGPGAGPGAGGQGDVAGTGQPAN